MITHTLQRLAECRFPYPAYIHEASNPDDDAPFVMIYVLADPKGERTPVTDTESAIRSSSLASINFWYCDTDESEHIRQNAAPKQLYTPEPTAFTVFEGNLAPDAARLSLEIISTRSFIRLSAVQSTNITRHFPGDWDDAAPISVAADSDWAMPVNAASSDSDRHSSQSAYTSEVASGSQRHMKLANLPTDFTFAA